ncbi:MAG: MBL fold metallo-hydrolase [Deltaproteobacteria bacterium]|nr:MBL fold metallo-hydrolase [Deltaproteobacteria bacterium]MBW2083974.1 MBL fold metallo-hydrolase [Deltaproteobacteria bacterium]HDM09562.1 MBL fold metallo-hydrolase [Desulfobacteraceae bacterium]
MRLTILYDNEVWAKGLVSSWGFSCLVETREVNILFDTGGDGLLLLRNMEKLCIDPGIVHIVFISHGHWDHMGGLGQLLAVRNVPVIVPASAATGKAVPGVRVTTNSAELYPGIYTTGELGGIEQSLVLRAGKGLLVVVGCSHPGVGNILKKASEYGRVKYLVGGLHGFDQFALLQDLDKVCPVHCTQYRQEIADRYPEKYIEGGAGKVLEF